MVNEFDDGGGFFVEPGFLEGFSFGELEFAGWRGLDRRGRAEFTFEEVTQAVG